MSYNLPDATTPFRSAEEQTLAFQDPQYKRDPQFRAAVEAKLTRGPYPGEVSPGHRIGSGATIVGGDGVVSQHPALSIETDDTDLQVARLRIEQDQLQQRIAEKQEADAKVVPPHYLTLPGWYAQSREARRIETVPFKSRDEMVAAMATPAYRNDPDTQAHIQKRVAVSTFEANDGV